MKHHTLLINSKPFLVNPYATVRNLHAIYFRYSFWINFKKRFTRKLGTVISNITKSSFFWTYTQLSNGVKSRSSLIDNPFQNQLSIDYFQQNTLIPFNFHNKVYNTLTIFFITLLTTFYLPTQNEFKLYYAFIWRSRNMLHYDFLNRFYFKLKNY